MFQRLFLLYLITELLQNATLSLLERKRVAFAVNFCGSAACGPFKGCSQRLVSYSAAGLADGRQLLARPGFGAAGFQVAHQERIRQHHQVPTFGLGRCVADTFHWWASWCLSAS